MGIPFNPETVEFETQAIPSELYEMKLVQLANALIELLEKPESEAEDGGIKPQNHKEAA